MSRWICIDDICIPSDENDWEELVAFADAIAEQEPIDIVRCGECKWFDSKGHCMRSTAEYGIYEDVRTDDFCSYGKVSEKPTGSEKPNNSKERSGE